MKSPSLTILLAFALGSATLNADTLRESYVADLSEQDHFNSKGERLTEAAAIIRQDRANFHKLGKRDPGDGGDRFFASADNREALERLIKRGTSTPAALRAIVKGTPTVIVNIHRSDSGQDYVNVAVIENDIEDIPADTFRESYVAFLSEADHFNSKGERLTEAAAIIRQDRANFHKLGKRDPGDGSDRFFADANNREILEQLLQRGRSNKSALRSIVKGTPTIIVKIYQAASGRDYVNVSVIE